MGKNKTEGGAAMKNTYKGLIEERAYWKRLLGLARAQGQSGESFVRCIKAVNHDLLTHNYR